MRSSTLSKNNVVDLKVRERVKNGVSTFIDRLGLEWFLEGDGPKLSFKIKPHAIERCAMWLCQEIELVKKDSDEGDIEFYLEVKNPGEFEMYKRMVRKEILRYIKVALER